MELWLSLRISTLVSFLDRYIKRYIPQLIKPVSGWRETTLTSWRYACPSFGWYRKSGNLVKSISDPLRTISLHGAEPTSSGFTLLVVSSAILQLVSRMSQLRAWAYCSRVE